ncbi:hypothetical protein HER18_07540 [Chryseobacterium sp. NEB161]|nr:hypothetical protein HER18_07540 [Chryseobacterium sp. NEB161]
MQKPKELFIFVLMSDNHRFLARNKQVRIFFDNLERKNPNWRIGALEKATADQFYISERTVRSILKGSGIYTFKSA